MKAVPLKTIVTIDRDQRQWTGRPYVGMENIESGTGRFIGSDEVATVKSTTFGFTDKHVLYGRLRPYLNKVLLPDFRGHCSTEIIPLMPSGDIDRSYLWYWLTSAQTVATIDATCTGARMPRANMDDILEILVPLPPLEEQRRIVAVLDEAFAAIAQATANAERNLANAISIYEASLDSYVTSALDSFGSTTLSTICIHITDGDHSPPPKADTGVPFVTISNIDKKSGKIDFEDTFFVPDLYYSTLKPSRRPKVGDLLYTVTGATLGVPSLVEHDRAFCFQRHIAIVKPEKHVSPEWLLHILRSPNVFRQASLGATGAAQKTVSLALLRGLNIPKSDRPAQLVAGARLTAIFQAANNLDRIYSTKLACLRELKQSLLHRAFTGDLATPVQPINLSADQSFATPRGTAQIIAFAYYCHEKRGQQRTFGHVKAQKALHLVESIGGIDLGRVPMKDAAGPNDFPHMLRAEEWAEAEGFFKFVRRKHGEGYDFKKLANFDALLSKASAATQPVSAALEKAIDLIVPMVSLEAELFATVHAAWNNLILDGATISDDAIVKEARPDWHDAKMKIPESKFRDTIKLIRAKGMEPDGSGKYVGGQGKLI